MIQAMHGRVTKFVIQILAVFLILSFGVWGIGDIFRGRSLPSDVAEVEGVKIPRQELEQEFRRAVTALQARLGPQFDSIQARRLGVLEQTLDGLIVARLFALETASLGLDAGDDLVRATIAADPAFQNRAGSFDSLAFRQALSSGNMSEAAYVASLRATIVRQQLTGSLTAASTVPRKLQEMIYDFRNERRRADVVRIARDTTPAAAEPPESEVVDYHRKNPALFTAPEYRNLTVVHFDPKIMAAEILIPEKRLREEYEYRLPSLTVPERRELQQILVRDKALAETVYQALLRGREFSEVATQTAKLPAGALSLGNPTRRELPEEIANAAFTLKKGGFSKPVRSALGWHILRVKGISGGKAPSFEEARKTINNDLAREKAIDALVAVANKFEDSLAGGATLEEAAAGNNATPLNIDAIDSRGMDRAGKRIAKAPADAKFRQAAFITISGGTSELTETDDGGFFMVRVNRVTPPVLRPLESVRAKVIAAWKAGQRDKQTKIRAESLLAAANTRGSLAAAAKEKGLKLEDSKPFSRFIQDPLSVIPPALAGAMFKAAKGARSMAAYDGGYAVAELKKIERRRPEDNASEFKNIGVALKAAIAGDIASQITAALRRRYEVSIDQRALEALF